MKRLCIVGLGPGRLEDLSLRAWQCLKEARKVFLRTGEHPLVPELDRQGISFTSFDYLYEQEPDFASVYGKMARILIDEATSAIDEGKVVFAVPGHPMVAERVVEILMQGLGEAFIETVPGISAVDAVWAMLGIDPSKGTMILDGLTFQPEDLDPRHGLLILQVYNPRVASEVKLRLMERYPDDFLVEMIQAAGVPEAEQRRSIPLYQLDRQTGIDHLTSVYVPPVTPGSCSGRRYPLDSLVEVMNQLLSPQGCPWDREQDHMSLRPYLIEETYEVIEAIDEADPDKMEEELGDLLLQIVFHAALAERNEYFDINDVILRITEKLIRRHPHVFDGVSANSTGEVLVNWEKIKQTEGQGSPAARRSYMDGIPKALPALEKALKVQSKAARVGFDWPDIQGPWDKIMEEIQELQEAEQEGKPERIMEELGDLLFAQVNLARFLKLDPETALSHCIAKFVGRFRYIEEQAEKSGKELDQLSLAEMDHWWEEAKNREEPKK